MNGPPQIINADILDGREPHLLVQRYSYPDHVYLVIRRPTDPDEEFAVSPGVEIDYDVVYTVSILLSEANEEDFEDEDFTEVFAIIYADEENQPVYAGEETADADPWLGITYDRNTLSYGAEVWETSDEVDVSILTPAIEEISAPRLDMAILQAVEALQRIRIDGPAHLIPAPEE